ncbi:NAD(P)H-binding protein [Streptomyces sp. NPDC002994]|uniref:NAD(P)H-binding protein n=1 Tax=Streptomyces sp. NPDC002994 TaxID=3154441 RepID=UPI00339F06AB
MTQARILVTGATGKVGGQVVAQLSAAGVPVRALVRRPGAETAAALPEGVEVTGGDLDDPTSLEAALDGVESVFLVWPFLTAEAAPPVLEVIGKHARRVVYLSSEGVGGGEGRKPSGDAITMFHTEMERLIEEAESGLEWTFLRPTGFAGNTLGWAEQIRTTGVVRAPFAGLARPLIHEADMAAVAVRALTTDALVGARPVLSGPGLLTGEEQLRIIGDALGRSLRFDEQSPDAAREEMTANGWPAGIVDAVLRAQAAMAASPEPVTDSVERITGSQARSFRQWAEDHAADFR